MEASLSPSEIISVFVVFFGGSLLFVTMIAALTMIPLLMGMVLWIAMLADCIQRDFPKPDEKIVWLLLLVTTWWIGAIIYFFVVKRKMHKIH